MFRRGCCDLPLVLQQLCNKNWAENRRGSCTLPLDPLSCTGGEKPSGREGKEGGFRAALLPVLRARLVWLGDSETATVATKGVAAGLQ